MPSYELTILLRSMSKPEVVSTLKRAAQEIFDRGGFLRKIENLGTRPTPYKISSHGMVHKEASTFVVQFDSPPSSITDLKEVYRRDVDIVRGRIFRVFDENRVEPPCTLDDEMKPPAYRKDVQEMIEIGKKKLKPMYKQNTGLDYYPFQR